MATTATPWCGQQAAKLYEQSGQFTSTINTSQYIGGVNGAPRGITYDDTHTPWGGNSGSVLYLQSGQITSTLKTSVSVSAIDAAVSGISFDGTNTPWCGDTADKLYRNSGQITSILQTSEDVQAIDSQVFGISFDGTDTPWSGRNGDKLYLQSSQFTSTLKTSEDISGVDNSPRCISWDGTNTPWCGTGGVKLYLTSSQFTSTLKDSEDVSSIDTIPMGICTNDFSSRVPTGASAPTWAANTSNIAATDAASDGEVDLTWDSASQAQGKDIGYIVEARTTAGPGAWGEKGRTTGTSFTVANLTNGTSYDFRVKAYARVETEPTTTPNDTDSATPTTAAIPDAPAIEATDVGNQDEVEVDIVPGDESDSTVIYYQGLSSGGLLEWPTPQVGTGTLTLSGLSVQTYLIYGIATRGGCSSDPSLIDFVVVAAADQYTAARTALYEWVKGVVGNPTVIWREPNAPQPSRQYVSIHMDPTTVVGSDYHSNADDSGVESVIGNREFVFSIQVHGQPSQTDGSASISILERLRSSLEKRSIQDTLKAAGLAFVAEEGFGDLAGIGGTEFEARVFMDLRFRTTYQDTDDVGFIGTATAPVGTYE